MKLLIIEDNPEIVAIVAQTLELRWPEASLTSTALGKEGVELVRKELPDIVILDLGLPDIDGFQALRLIREFSNVPVVILTVRGDETDKIRGLEAGADDYVSKPFSPGELVARLKALLRRSRVPEATTAVTDQPAISGKVRIDFTTQQVTVGDRVLVLGPREYDLLYYLVANKEKVVSNKELLEKIFPENKNDIRFLSVYIKKLREKLEPQPDNPEIIINDGETGYRFVG